MVIIQTMSYVIYNDSKCHTPKLSTFLAFYPSARVPVLPERQFCQSATFARAQVLPERQFCQSATEPPVCHWKLKEFAAFLSNHIIYTELN